ncbi:MAG: hypothetical protein A2V98_01395 [Planctomycetes bacterium RBG_16_64_12]|nr:MAG: hypothetical protein A2V98_01395 [Planctomycetes bacterium RBG_16_64_12]
MASSSRTSRFNKVHKVLKKHYQMVPTDPDRTVFEQLVFACCLENAHYDRAEEACAALEHNFFDWNEIRVTTIRELSEVMARLPEPPAAANRVKRVLQSIFELTYSFDLEELRKQNLGPAVEHLKKIDGTTNFSVAYVTQMALGGHAIPVDAGVLGALHVVGLATEEDVRAGVVPGLERAIAKSKGLEFGSQLHQLGADFVADPYAPALQEILLEIDPDARRRLPKRGPRKRTRASRKKTPTGNEGESAGPKPIESVEEVAPQQEADPPKDAPPAEEQEAEAPAPEQKRAAAKRKPTTKKKAEAGTGKSPSAGLSKRKPR